MGDKVGVERIVVGCSVASLVAADALAAAGQSVRLLVDDSALGGEFAPVLENGRACERGVGLLDLSYEKRSTPPLSSYEPGPQGYLPYAATIADYVDELLGDDLTIARKPQMFVNGRVVDDLYFTADPAALRAALSAADRLAVRAEALACWRGMGDAAGLLAPDTLRRLDRMTLGDASFVNHGGTFHRLLMEPIAKKFMIGGCADVIAAHRAKIRLPLFRPSALAQAAGEDDVTFVADRLFQSVCGGGGAGALVKALVSRLNQAGVRFENVGALAELTSLANGTTHLSMSSGAVIDAVYPVLGVGVDQLFASVGADYEPERLRSVVCWIEVDDADVLDRPSLLNVVDCEIPALRIGVSGADGRSVLTVDLRHDTASTEIESAAIQALERTGILRAGAVSVVLGHSIVTSVPTPTQANAERFAKASSMVGYANLDAEIVGAGLHFGADSLGEQIVQGLRAAQALTR